jgi:hypothetical protein
MRSVSNVDKVKTDFMFNNAFPGNCYIYEIMCKNIAEPGRPQILAAWCLRITRWLRKSTNTNPEYAIFTVFSLQQ